MNTFKRLSLTILAALSTYYCYGHKYKLVVDSFNSATRERIKVLKLYIGKNDYHQFGPMIMEQKGKKYYITFPFFEYTDPPPRIFNPYPFMQDKAPDDIMPKGTKIVIQLDNGKQIESETDQDIKVLWHYWWDYSWNHHRRYSMGVYTGVSNNRYRDKVPINFDYNNYCDCNLYGLNWEIKFEFTKSDMLLIRKYRILSAYIIREGRKMYLPIKRKHSIRIENSAAAILYK